MKYLPSNQKLKTKEPDSKHVESQSLLHKDYINFTKIFYRIIFMNIKKENISLSSLGFLTLLNRYKYKLKIASLSKLVIKADMKLIKKAIDWMEDISL